MKVKLKTKELLKGGVVKLRTITSYVRLVESIYILKTKSCGTLCLSTQLMCPVKCWCCRVEKTSTQCTLRACEILVQLHMFINLLSRCLYFSWGCVKSLVFKGVNELLLNFFHVIRAIKGINRTKTLGISYQTIIISTTGVAPTSHKVFEGVAVPLTLVASAFSMDSKETLIPFKNVRLSGYVLSEVQPNHLVCTGESCLTGYMNNYIIDAKVLIEKFHSLGYQANIIPFNTGDSGRCFIASFNPRGKSSVNLCLLVVLKSTPEKHKRKCWDFLQSINNTETT